MARKSPVRSWLPIGGVLVVVFGLGIGAGVALSPGKTSATLPAAQVAEQQRIGAPRYAEKQQAVARRMRQIAVRQQVLARRERQAAEQQGNSLYPVPMNVNDPNLARDSARNQACVAAVRKGIAPETFRRTHSP
jgi:hypothetical protein